MVSTLLDRVQAAFGKRFFVTAFLPTVVIVAFASIQLWGIEATRRRLGVWAERPVGDALFDIAATVVALFLVAYVVDSLRWSLRALYEGTWPRPLRALREWAVLRMSRKCDKNTSKLQTALDQMSAVAWISGGLGKVSYAEPFESAEDAVRSLRRAGSELKSLTGRCRHRRVNRTVRGVHRLWRLQGNRLQVASREEDLDALLRWTIRESTTKRATKMLSAASVRLEQRRTWLDERLELGFPQRNDTQPTQLGNVMARADSYAATRYGIPLKELWPRLEIFTDSAVLTQVDDSLSRVDFGLAMTTGGLGLTILGTASFLTGGPPIGVVIAAGSLAGSLLAYRFAVLSGEAYGKRISAAVDVYRRQTLRSLGVEPPLSLTEEKEVWDKLHHFLARADPVELSLVEHNAKGQDSAPPSS